MATPRFLRACTATRSRLCSGPTTATAPSATRSSSVSQSCSPNWAGRATTRSIGSDAEAPAAGAAGTLPRDETAAATSDRSGRSSTKSVSEVSASVWPSGATKHADRHHSPASEPTSSRMGRSSLMPAPDGACSRRTLSAGPAGGLTLTATCSWPVSAAWLTSVRATSTDSPQDATGLSLLRIRQCGWFSRLRA